MARPAFKVADVFRRHGAAYREANAGHLDRCQRRVMAAIEACRTAALGGHVHQCKKCGLKEICYCSCIMGKFGNGESDRINSDAIELSSYFHSPLRVPPQQSDKQ